MLRMIPILMLALVAAPAWAAPLAPAAAEAEAPAAAEAEVGHVVAVEGRATATLPGSEARVLACGDPIRADERLRTAPGAKLVVARSGRHVHLGPESLMVLRQGAGEQPLAVLLRGNARLLDSASGPSAHVATAAGPFRFEADDVELRRLATGELQVCVWSSQGSVCQRLDASGRMRVVVEEGPRLDLGIRNVCELEPPEEPVWTDFASAPPVSAGPQSLFEPDFDAPEPGCDGDECTPVDPGDPPDPEIVYTVEQPGFFDPLAGLP